MPEGRVRLPPRLASGLSNADLEPFSHSIHRRSSSGMAVAPRPVTEQRPLIGSPFRRLIPNLLLTLSTGCESISTIVKLSCCQQPVKPQDGTCVTLKVGEHNGGEETHKRLAQVEGHLVPDREARDGLERRRHGVQRGYLRAVDTHCVRGPGSVGGGDMQLMEEELEERGGFVVV